MFLFAATGVAGYFFHPRETSTTRQNRAIALSHYACAPLAWTPAPVLLFTVMILLEQTGDFERDAGFRVLVLIDFVAFVIAAFQVAVWWRCTLVLLRGTTRCSGTRVTCLGFTLPILWGVCGLFILGVLPLAYLFVSVLILSLRQG